MIEIVFSDSACGSLKMAKSVGKQPYNGEPIGVIVSRKDGGAPSTKEIEAAQKKAEEEHRLEMEKAVPMEGDAHDVFGFNLMLSIGDISADNFLEKRAKTIEFMWSIYPSFADDEPFDILNNMQKGIDGFKNRITQDDEVRIWYSDTPNEMCGLYWFMSELLQLSTPPKAVHVVKFSGHHCNEGGALTDQSHWGELSPSNWNGHAAFAQEVSVAFQKHCAKEWKMLQDENANLRAVLNGKLCSVSDDIYDNFIYREIENQEDEFNEAMLIGSVLCKYQPSIGDMWLAHRIEKIIAAGTLQIASEPLKDMPIYHRKLKKAK